MNARYKILMLGGMLLGGGILAAMAVPFGPPEGGPPHGDLCRGRHLLELARAAGAGDEQLDLLSDELFQQRTAFIDLHAALEKAELALDQSLAAGTPDDAAVTQAVEAVNAARASLFMADIMGELKVRRILGNEIARKIKPPMPPPGMDRLDGAHRPGVMKGRDAERIVEP